MNLLYAKDPYWADRNNTLINLTVRFQEIDEDLPFTANPNDPMAYGRDIFVRAAAGEFGTVAPFSATPPTIEVVSQKVTSTRNAKLAETDWTQLPDIPQATRELWEPYRQELRDIPQNPDFPWYNLVVVETPFGYDIDVNLVPWPVPPT